MLLDLRAPRSKMRPIIINKYGLYDATSLSLTPLRWSATAAQAIFGSPLNPLHYTLAGRMIAASADVFTSVTKRRGKPDWNIDATMDVIDERPFCRLVRFSRDRGYEVPQILMVAALSGHYATLMRGTIEALIGEHDVYVTDWADAKMVPLDRGPFDLDDYISYTIDYIRMLGPDIHVMAVCQPAPAVLAAVALMAAHRDPAQPRTMTIMAGPVDVRVNPNKAAKIAEKLSLDFFERNVITKVPVYYPGAGRRVYPGMVQLGAFISMNAKRHVNAHIAMYNELVRGDGEAAAVREKFYDEYLSVMDVTAEYFLTTAEQVFMKHALPNGTLTWRGEKVDLSAVRSTALMTVEGELDDLCSPGMTVAAHDLCTSLTAAQREHLLQPGVGHYGVFNGRRFREEIMPRISRFMRKHEHGGRATATSYRSIANAARPEGPNATGSGRGGGTS
jgi:poly(3-hydroxybutyrate) depolymerase